MGIPVIRTIPHVGRVQVMGGKLVCQFNSAKLRDLFGCITWEFTHYSDVDLLAHDMCCASLGKYAKFYTSVFASKVQSVPYGAQYGH